MSVRTTRLFGVSLLFAAACAGSPHAAPPPTPPAPPLVQPPPAASGTAQTAPPPPAPPAPAPCDPGNVLLFTSPRSPVRGTPMRVVAVFDHPIVAELSVASKPDAKNKGAGAAGPSVSSHDVQGGPPYFLVAQVDAPAAGAYSATLTGEPRCNAAAVRKDIRVVTWAAAPPAVAKEGLWRTRASWTPSMENLYSAWIEHLFDAPLDTQPSWPALHEVLRDPARNLLFDHLGAHEDEQGVTVRPDCADLPYFLRAYFAFKLGLPFGWSTCSRGDKGSPPTCGDWTTNEDDTAAAARVREARDRGGQGPQGRQGRPRVRVVRRVLARRARGRRAVRRRSHARGRRPEPTTIPSRSRRRRSARDHLRRSVRSTCSSSRAASRRPREPAACCSRSTASPTAPWPASASGAATSSSPSTRPSAPPAGSAFAPSRATARASCAARRTRSSRTWTSRPSSTTAVSRDSTTGSRSSSRPCRSNPTRAFLETMQALEDKSGRGAVGRQRPEVSGQRKARGADARGLQALRDHGVVGGLLDAVARPAAAHRHRRRARLPPRVARRPERYAMPAGKSPRT